MKTFSEALDFLLSKCESTIKVQVCSLPFLNARVLAKPIVSTIAVPASDVSMMDGYALSTFDTYNDTKLRISQRIPAGTAPDKLEKNTVARIFTGAYIPDGANAVVMQEDVEITEDGSHIEIKVSISNGQHIRKAGAGIQKGQVILDKGKRLKPQDIGLIASIGIEKVEVYSILKVATFTTGSELLEPGTPSEVGKIYNSNRYVLNSTLKQMSYEVIDFGVVQDNLDSTIKVMEEASKVADVIITTGGVSVGDEDYIKKAVNKLGKIDLWQVRMKPGKPLAYGSVNGTTFIGLPGNPVSAFATFMLFAKPYLRRKQGEIGVIPQCHYFKANFETTKPSFRREFARACLVNIKNETVVELFLNQDSGVLISTVLADGFVVIPEDTIIKKGDKVAFYHFDCT